MDKVIYKYTLVPDFSGRCRIEVPQGSKFLAVGEQASTLPAWYEASSPAALVAWYEVDPLEKSVNEYLWVYPTGIKFDKGDTTHLGTVFMTSGLVFHIYGFKEVNY